MSAFIGYIVFMFIGPMAVGLFYYGQPAFGTMMGVVAFALWTWAETLHEQGR